MRYTSRGLRRRRNSDKWDVTLSHRDPLTGELVSTYHSVEATTLRKAERARDELILELELKGDAYNSKLTLSEYLEKFIQYKEGGMQVERSTVDHYRKQAKVVCRYLGHSNVAMTLNTYAEVDPDAKRAAVGKIGEAFDADLDGVFADELEAPAFTMSFTVEQLRAMLAEAERKEADDALA